MVSRSIIGQQLPPVRGHVEAGRLRAFRRTTGSANPSDPVTPPTYLFALEMLDAERPLAFVEDIGADISAVLHSEQAFTYHAPIRAGDEILFTTVVSDVFDKKAGALTFVVQDTVAINQHGEHVADVRRTLVIRN